MLANRDIRDEIEQARIRHWEIANALGVSPETFSRWIRYELDPSKKEKIRHIILSLKTGK